MKKQMRNVYKNILKIIINYRKNKVHYVVMVQSTVHTNLMFYFIHIDNLSVDVLLL